MYKKTGLLALAIVFCFSLIFTSCGSGTTTADATTTGAASVAATSGAGTTAAETTQKEVTGKVVMSFIQSEISDDQMKAFMQEYPGIQLERVSADTTKIMAMIAADNAPDVIRVEGLYEVPTYIKRGLALPLDEYIAKSESIKMDDLLPVSQMYVADGKIYGFPKDWSADAALWANTKLFKAAGVAVPSTEVPLTYTELADIANKLTVKTDGKVTQWGFASLFASGFRGFDLMTVEQGASIWNDDFSKAVLSSIEAKTSLQYFVDLAKSGAMGSALNPLSDGWGGVAFMEDKIGMFQAGYWYTGMLKGNDKLKDRLSDFVCLPAPVVSQDKRYSPCMYGTGGIIYSKSKSPEAAWKFVEWYLGPNGQPAQERTEKGWGLPVYNSLVAKLPQQTDFDKQVYGVVQGELKYGGTMSIRVNPYANCSSLYNTYDKYFTELIYGRMTIDEGAAKLEEEFNALVTEGKDILGEK